MTEKQQTSNGKGRCRKDKGRSDGKKDQKKGNSLKNLRGECEALGHHVYIMNDPRQADKYGKTTEAICNYIASKWDHGQDVATALSMGWEFDHDKHKPDIKDYITVATGKKAPKDPKLDDMDDIEKLLLQSDIKQYTNRVYKYNDNMNKAFALIWGQCTLTVKNKIETRKDWKTLKDEHDPLKLLAVLTELVFNYQDGQYPLDTVYQSISDLLTMKQQEKESHNAYQK